MGSDGTVGANKEVIKIIADATASSAACSARALAMRLASSALLFPGRPMASMASSAGLGSFGGGPWLAHRVWGAIVFLETS